MSAAGIVFWACAAAVAYTYVGYPLLVAALAAAFGRGPRRRGITPTVSVLLVARDEETRVAERLDNLLRLDYPEDRLEILLGSDGSTDATVQAARPYADRVRVLDFPARRGKAAVLNDLVARARGEILAFADARQTFSTGTMRALVAPFHDPRVGAVSGELVLEDRHGRSEVGAGVGAYWRYEKAIRKAESALGSTVGATGAIYAIRRALYAPLPPDTILDDVLVPMRVVRKGYRVVFEPRATAFDRPSADAQQEFRRKVRTIAGNFQLFARERWLLAPGRNPVWFQTVSHKVLRLVGPALLAGTFLLSALLAADPVYGFALLLQTLVLTAALVGATQDRARRRLPVASAALVFVLLQAATVVAFVRFAQGRLAGIWEPGAQSDSAAPSNSTRSSERSIR
jgi:cellulose synthase/poly-beta-1,6-N-acetylglucosamine synthase-like glycosyltransferase